VIHQHQNEGKAIGLTTAAMLTDAEFLMCIDGDSLLDSKALGWMLRHFLRDPAVAAVTGNPRIRTRTSLLGRMQVGEFSSIVGLIKRTQQLYGYLLTVSGVVSMFRKSALLDVGYWSPDMLTEDIDISWKLQVRGWKIEFEPRALSCAVSTGSACAGQRVAFRSCSGMQAPFSRSASWRCGHSSSNMRSASHGPTARYLCSQSCYARLLSGYRMSFASPGCHVVRGSSNSRPAACRYSSVSRSIASMKSGCFAIFWIRSGIRPRSG
jgi:cellulose synthase/poly-beta-1,6-N-acetylglucosamine synthase-like glycosyltransferase